MHTEYIQVDREEPDLQELARAATYLQQGGLVAFPTETVYGLGANGLDSNAVARIYEAKGRPSDNPLILHIAEPYEVEKLAAAIPANAKALMETYWPGPLTIVLKRSAAVPDIVTGGLDTVAIRLPASKAARELIRLAAMPLAAPSANISGRPSPTQAEEVLRDLAGKIEAVVDAGECEIGLESTVIDCTTPVPTLLRPGGITLEMLLATLGEVELDPALQEEDAVPRSPGMKYKHYAPNVPMQMVEAPAADIAAIMQRHIAEKLAAGIAVGAVVSEETAAQLPPHVDMFVLGSRGDAAAVAANLYQGLRYFDDRPVAHIYTECFPENGLGLAVMNRLRKASGYQIISQ